MDITQAIRERHSVRSFTDREIPKDTRDQLEAEILRCNAAGNLSIRLVCDEAEAFDSTMARYGKFDNVRNYLVLAGPPSEGLEQRCGYYGERLVLLAQQLGLNTCWVAVTFKKRYVKKMLGERDKLVVVIALGYGTTQGSSHKVKRAEDVCAVPAGSTAPAWFSSGVEYALLAPTAVNQQRFLIELTEGSDEEGRPVVSLTGKSGAYSEVDLGIVRLHFEAGVAGASGSFSWDRPL